MAINHEFIPNVFFEYYLDTRRALKNNKYPLKLRIYDTQKKINYFLKTNHEFSSDFYKNEFPRSHSKHNKIIKDELNSNLTYCKELSKKIIPFDFNIFKQKYLNNKNPLNSLKYFYDEKMQDLKKFGKIGTLNTYNDSFRSIEIFLNFNSKNIDHLTFNDINFKWLNDYENFILNKRKCTVNTLGIYLRPLRAMFNEAIKQNIIDADTYSFGKKSYQIKTSTNKKDVFSKSEIEILESIIPKSPSESLAKDFWLFSYYTCGINLTDLAYLKKTNIKNGSINFFRKKTESNRTNNIELSLPLHEKNKLILDRLVNYDKEYIFGIIDTDSTPEANKIKIKLFNSLINKNFIKLIIGKLNSEKTTYYTARHSWATHMIQCGAPITYIRDKLGHTSIKTTSSYIANLPVELEEDFLNKVFYEK